MVSTDAVRKRSAKRDRTHRNFGRGYLPVIVGTLCHCDVLPHRGSQICSNRWRCHLGRLRLLKWMDWYQWGRCHLGRLRLRKWMDWYQWGTTAIVLGSWHQWGRRTDLGGLPIGNNPHRFGTNRYQLRNGTNRYQMRRAVWRKGDTKRNVVNFHHARAVKMPLCNVSVSTLFRVSWLWRRFICNTY
jgi:hypothetical protein